MSNHCNAKCGTPTGGRQAELELELERCNREIERATAEIMERVEPDGALLGLRDWQYEKRLIEAELACGR